VASLFYCGKDPEPGGAEFGLLGIVPGDVIPGVVDPFDGFVVMPEGAPPASPAIAMACSAAGS